MADMDMDMDMSTDMDMDSDNDVSVDTSGDYEGFDSDEGFDSEGISEPEYFTVEELENHFDEIGDDKEALSNYKDLLESGEVAVWENQEFDESEEASYDEGLDELVAADAEIQEDVDEPEYFTAEELENHFEQIADDKEALNNYRNLLESGEVAVWEEEELDEGDSVKVLTRDITPEVLESREHDTEEVLDMYRENLREYGVDEESIETFVEGERDKINAEYESLDAGDTQSNIYYPVENWSDVADSMTQSDTLEDIGTADYDTGMNEPEEYGQMDVIENPAEGISETDINYDEIYEAIEQEALAEGFEDIEITRDAERLDRSLDSFDSVNWENLSLDEQKQSMETLADYVVDAVGLKNPPTIEYYNNAVEGDYGGFDASTNTLRVNEYMLYQSDEAVDTIAHEVWHAHQYECAANPQCARDHQYRYNFQNYIGSEYGQEAYESQLIEAEARAFASQFKNRLSFIKGR